MNLLHCEDIPINEIEINKYELTKRLHISPDYKLEEIDKNLERLKAVAKCKFASIRMPIQRIDEKFLDIGFGKFESKNLLKNLKDSKEVFIFAATLGIGVDRLLAKLSKLSASELFITDALASALAESSMDEAERRTKGRVLCRPRFSPGFGDLGLEVQPGIIKLLNANRLLGISLGKSYLMTPIKSVTAIMGIID